eukprot:c26859_g1_i1.p1 GENE.c26859_g1_i1~~c26859_g1_i1.p1  ORF type:complete len:308 (-),score=44.70 c26859_g1_i1:194-1051(-)
MVLRQYQRWPSDNMFFCAGHCITGPAEDWPYRIMFALLIFVPSVLFFGFESEHLWEISPATVAVPAVLLALMVINWMLCACTDPGILPRGEKENNKENVHTMEVTEGDKKVVYRWCHTCKIWRPPRASHCPECNNCVREFDHHCPVIGTCIGARNVKYFFLTVLFGYSLLLFVIIDTILFFVIKEGVHHQHRTLGIAFVVILGVLVGVPLTGFAGFHFIMMFLSGRTTKEWVKNIAVNERRSICTCEPSRIYPRKPLVLMTHDAEGGVSDDASEVGPEEQTSHLV